MCIDRGNCHVYNRCSLVHLPACLQSRKSHLRLGPCGQEDPECSDGFSPPTLSLSPFPLHFGSPPPSPHLQRTKRAKIRLLQHAYYNGKSSLERITLVYCSKFTHFVTWMLAKLLLLAVYLFFSFFCFHRSPILFTFHGGSLFHFFDKPKKIMFFLFWDSSAKIADTPQHLTRAIKIALWHHQATI